MGFSQRNRENAKELNLCLEWTPWHREFLRNLRDLIWPVREPSLNLSSRPGEFWPDVFVPSFVAWGKIAQSVLGQACLVACALLLLQFWPRPSRVVRQAEFNPQDVLYYSPSEYLAPLDTGSAKPQRASKGDPARSEQPIISVPADSDNRKQTIVTPPAVKLNQDIRLPNIVAWTPLDPAVPMAATETMHSRLELPTDAMDVVAPAPELSAIGVRSAAIQHERAVAPAPDITTQASLREPILPQRAAVVPAPDVREQMSRRVGDIDISLPLAVAPAPKLTVQAGERWAAVKAIRPGAIQVVAPAPNIRAVEGRSRERGWIRQARVAGPALQVTETSALRGQPLRETEAVPPPPSAQGLSSKPNRGRLIALNVNPLPPASIEPPVGNRRGSFAVTPGGKKNATATPEAEGNRTGTFASAASKNTTDLPSGLHVGVPEHSRASAVSANGRSAGNSTGGQAPGDDKKLEASITLPHVTAGPHHAAREVPAENASETEQRIFGGRPFYAMALNVPNLNSAGGSWVMHFAELDENIKGVLMAPEAIREVDPAYPLELMRHNVHGTVTLYAVIRSDGTIGNVRVLNGVDDQLDQYACEALEKWKFLPATKNGTAVPLAAIVKIPFRPIRSAF